MPPIDRTHQDLSIGVLRMAWEDKEHAYEQRKLIPTANINDNLVLQALNQLRSGGS